MDRSMSKAGLVLAGGALALAGYFFGTTQTSAPAVAQTAAPDGVAVQIAPAPDAPGAAPGAPAIAIGHDADGGFHGVVGVTIPSGGAALVKGKDGNAYIVDSKGMFVRASQSGKPLPLP